MDGWAVSLSEKIKEMKRALRHIHKRNILRTMAISVLLAVFLFCGWKVFSILSDYKAGEENYEVLAQEYTTNQPSPATDPYPIPAAEADFTEEQLPAETAPITVDFDTLLADCPDVVGWIYCADTPINYPIVQAQDNSYYLRRLLDGTYNSSGSIFMDYRCASDFSGWNTVIYGRNMKNEAMFGTLQDYKNQEYYDAHPVLYLLTPTQDYKIDLIGGYTTPGTAEDTYGIPQTQDGRDALIAKVQQHSTFQTDTAVNAGERLITLSTCAYEYDNARYVLVGVLRPLEPAEKGGNNNDQGDYPGPADRTLDGSE